MAVENVLEFDLDTVNNYDFVDIAQCASLMSRKLIRQGQQFVIQNIEFISDSDNTINVYRLPAAWYAVNAWVKAYSLWQKQQHQALEESESRSAKWRDFKVTMSQGHSGLTKYVNNSGDFVAEADPTATAQRTVPFANTIPKQFVEDLRGDSGAIWDGTQGAVYDWTMSKVIFPSTATVNEWEGDLWMLGPNNGAEGGYVGVGIIAGYGDSRARPNPSNPNIVESMEDMWMRDMFDLGETYEMAGEDAAIENNEPPYVMGTNETGTGGTKAYYPGGAEIGASVLDWPLDTIVLNGAATNNFSIGGTGAFVSNLGLLYITNDGNGSITMRITLALDEKGEYLTRTMKEAN